MVPRSTPVYPPRAVDHRCPDQAWHGRTDAAVTPAHHVGFRASSTTGLEALLGAGKPLVEGPPR